MAGGGTSLSTPEPTGSPVIHRWSVALAALGCALLAFGTLSHIWVGLKLPTGLIDIGFGLTKTKMCMGPMCESADYTEILSHGERAFVHVGRITYGAGLITAALALVAGGMLATGRNALGPVSMPRLASIAAQFALVLGAAFMLLRPDALTALPSVDQMGELGSMVPVQDGVPWSFVSYLAGCAAIIAVPPVARRA